MDSILDRHDRPCLQFSGGKDSIACLLLLRKWWPKLTVAWVNTGDAFPETLDIVNYVRSVVGGFLEINSDVRAWVKSSGMPVDMLPVRNSPTGIAFNGPATLLQPFVSCCYENIWAPLNNAMVDGGFTLIIRGQKLSDKRKSPVRSGKIIGGVEYLFPLEEWSDDAVIEYLGEALPNHYKWTKTSLDCRHCTAYLDENAEKMRYLKRFHPELFSDVLGRLTEIKKACCVEFRHLNAAISAGVNDDERIGGYDAVNYGAL